MKNYTKDSFHLKIISFVELASALCKVSIAAVFSVQEKEPLIKSFVGIEEAELREFLSLISNVNHHENSVVVVDDMNGEIKSTKISSYFQIPLINKQDEVIAKLFVAHELPFKLDETQINSLRLVAEQVQNFFNTDSKIKKLEKENKELKGKEELLHVTLSANKLGTWELDLETGVTYWSDEVFNIHEVSKDFEHNLFNNLEFYPPEDRMIMDYAIRNSLKTDTDFDVTARLITAKNNLRWIRSVGHVQTTSDGRKKLIGSFQDITVLKESEIKFQGIFNSTFTFIGFLDKDGVLLEANDTAINMAGITSEDVIGKKFWDCYWWQISEDTKEVLKVKLAEAAQGKEVSYEVEVWIKDKTPITILFSLRPLFDSRGKVNFIIPEGRPIQDIVDVRNRYSSVIDGTNVGTWEWNVQTGETIFNAKWAEILGYKLEELEPVSIETWTKFAHPDDLEESTKKLNLCFEKKEEFYEAEIRMKHKSGHWIWVFDRGKVFAWTSDGKPLKMYGTHQDITQRKLDERNREELLERFELIGSQIPGVIYQFKLTPDGSMHFPFVSSGVKKVFGLSPNKITRNTQYLFNEVIHPEDRERIIKSIEESAHNMSVWQQVFRVYLPSKQLIWVEGNATPQKLEDGSILWHGYIQDVSRRRKVEEKLEISEKAFRGNFENAGIGMALFNKDGQWIKINKRITEMVGYSEEELQKITFREITHPEDLETDLALLDELISGKRDHYQLEKRYFHKNGEVVYIILVASMVKNNEGEILFFVTQIIDITNLKLAEQKLSSALSKNQAILDASSEVSIISTNLEGIITDFNKGAERMLGYKAEELIGKFTPHVLHVEDEIDERGKEFSENFDTSVDGFNVLFFEAQKGLTSTREWHYKRKDGSIFPVLLSITSIMQGNKISGYLGVATDISQLKKAEEEIRNLLLITQDKNDRLNNFAHIVTHNLRSHAAGILGMLELIKFEEKEIFEHEYLQLLDKSSLNLKKTIENLNDIVKQSFTIAGDLKMINLQDAIEQNRISLLSTSNKNNVRVINEVDKSIEIKAIPAYLDSIILNFISNGIKYSDKNKNSYVKIFCEKLNDKILIGFEDNGLGIDLETHAPQLFGMYKTFHEHKDSRGVGLFITKNQIETMGGSVQVESKVGEGTTFKVYLPIK